MNRWKRGAALALAPLLLAGCGGKKEEAPLPVSWEMKSERWTAEGCADGEPCAYVAFFYPVFAGEERLAGSLNGHVRSELVRPEGEGGDRPTPEEDAASFLQTFREFKRASPESPQVWFLERTIEVLPSLHGTIGLRAEERVYGGGAHGNETATLVAFDGAECRRIGLGDLVAPGAAEAFDRTVEKRFREARTLGPDEDLAGAGFWFPGDGRFRAGTNFAAVKEGLLFHFDPYEVGPYSLGPTDFLVPWRDFGKELNGKWASRVR